MNHNLIAVSSARMQAKYIQKMIGLLSGNLRILNFEQLLHHKSTRHIVWTMCLAELNRQSKRNQNCVLGKLLQEPPSRKICARNAPETRWPKAPALQALMSVFNAWIAQIYQRCICTRTAVIRARYEQRKKPAGFAPICQRLYASASCQNIGASYVALDIRQKGACKSALLWQRFGSANIPADLQRPTCAGIPAPDMRR